MILIEHFKDRIYKLPKPVLFVFSIILILTLGLIDYITGTEYSFSLFYLLPILLVTWFREIQKGIFCSLLAAIIWFFVEMSGDRSFTGVFVPYWNTLVRFTFYLIVMLLIQRIRKLYKLLDINSKTDNLTGFHNIRSFYEQLTIETKKFQRSRRFFSLAYIDIDNFKQVNDNFGHDEGNVLLKTFAETVKSSMRQQDIPGRIGGDEFAILFSETNEQEVQPALSKVMQNLYAHMDMEKWNISFSIGVITFHTLPDSIDALIKKSDELMYIAKKDGKNRIYTKIYDGDSGG